MVQRASEASSQAVGPQLTGCWDRELGTVGRPGSPWPFPQPLCSRRNPTPPPVQEGLVHACDLCPTAGPGLGTHPWGEVPLGGPRGTG